MLRLGGLLALLVTSHCDGDGKPGKPAAKGEGGDGIAYHVGPRQGRWHEPRTRRFDEDLTDEQRAAIEELEAVGYVEGKHGASELRGVTRHEEDGTAGGWNLFTSAHRAVCQLMDMDGKVRHTWQFPLQKAWPKYPGLNKLSTFWRRCHLYPNGDLLGIYEGLGMVKVDRDSNLIWKSPVRAHHDVVVNDDGTLWVLSREARLIPEIHPKKPVLEDFISHIGTDGQELTRFSLLEAMRGTAWDQDWSERIHLGGDLQHTNTLELLDGSIADEVPEFAAGNFLISMLLLDMVAVVDANTKKVVWAQVGPFKAQHDPQILDTGRMMIFDNQGLGDASRILEVDPASGEVVWTYAGTEVDPFYSETCGLAQRLPDGNTLITESDYGRAFEITADGKVVWEFYNPHRAGPEEQYIATMMEMWRLPADLPLDWLD